MQTDTHTHNASAAGLTIRELQSEDSGKLRHLAALEGRSVPRGHLLGAEVEGRLLAVVSIESGEAIADPFSRTDELVGLLKLRSQQLRQRRPRVRSRFLGNRPAISAPQPAGGLVGLYPRAS